MPDGEQRNEYKGEPPRPWVRIRLAAPNGTRTELDVVADTGSPIAAVIGEAVVQALKLHRLIEIDTNFGRLKGAWMQLEMPEFGVNDLVLGYGGDQLADACRANH